SDSAAWVVADLALFLVGAIEIPVPLAFTPEQGAHLLRSASLCIVDQGSILAPALSELTPQVQLVQPAAASPAGLQQLPAGRGYAEVVKVIHTSGTTSEPKGVQIRGTALALLVDELAQRLGAMAARRYLSLVPLSLLIEQVSAIYLPLTLGGTLILLPPG